MLILFYWLPGRHSQQNFLEYKFGFLMVPTQVNNSKSSYCLLRGNGIIAVYYPLLFISEI